MNKFDELTGSMAQPVTHRGALKKFASRVASVALGCLGIVTVALGQTSVVCDLAGDAVIGNGKAKGSRVPLWLDISYGVVSADSHDNILFTLTLNAPVPAIPAWSGVDDGGQLTWGWRLIGDLADLGFVRNGCIGGNGTALPAAYYLDLIWSLQTSAFRARLVDNTSCTEVLIPFAFSADRTQITLLLAKNLLTNRSLIPDPDNFQFLAATVVWNSDSMANSSYHHVDWAPDLRDGQVVTCIWSASSDSTCCCP